MKKGFAVVFWIVSGTLFLMALAMLPSSLLSFALMLAGAVVINPLFIEEIKLKKGLTALLAIGLFVASVAVLPEAAPPPTERAAQSDAAITAVAANADRSAQEAVADPARESADSVQAEPTEFLREISPAPTVTPRPTTTPTPNPTPTPTPTPTATPRKTATPSPTAGDTRSSGADIEILDYSSVVGRGEYAFIKIQGAPNTDYDCSVRYKSGMSTASGL